MPIDPTEIKKIAEETGQTESQVIAALAAHEKQAAATAAQQSVLNQSTANYSNELPKLAAALGDVGIKLNDIGNITGKQATQFGLLTAGILTTKEAFTNLEGVNPKALGSFNDQAQTLIETLKTAGPGTQIAIDATKKLAGTLTGLGASNDAITAALKRGGKGLAEFAQNMITGADNTLRFETMMMQAAASGGAMDTLYNGLKNGDKAFTGIGQHLDNLNGTYKQFIDIQGEASSQTAIMANEMAQYTNILLRSDAGWDAMAKGVDVSGTKMNALTAVTRLAQGAGLDIGETFKNINKTIYETGMSYEGATGFATRFIDVSKDLHAQSSQVSAELMKTSNAFKLWNTNGEQSVKMNQGLADSVKNYARALEAAGVPAANALEIASKQTMQMGQLNEAQESFISQQTGGAGGIKGALEYEELVKKDPVAAQKKMVQTMEQQIGGKAITREEALKTGQEDKYMLERKLLMSGSLGMKADTTQEAEDMLAAMAKGVEYKKTSAQDVKATAAGAIQKGKEQQELTMTAVKQVNVTAERLLLAGGGINAGTMEKALSAKAGETGTGQNVAGSKLLRGTMDSNAVGGNNPATSALHAFGKLTNDASTHIKGMATSFKEQVAGPGETPDLGGTGKEDALKKLSSPLKDPNMRPGFPMLGGGHGPTVPQTSGTGYVPAGRQVGAAVSTKTNDDGTSSGGTAGTGARGGVGGGSGGAGAGAGGPIPVTLVGGALTMNLTGACPHCKAPITTSLQSQATNVAANTGSAH